MASLSANLGVGGVRSQSYLSTPAESHNCPLGDCTFCLLLDFLDGSGNLLLCLSEIRVAFKESAKGFLLLFRVGWKPGSTDILALQEVRDKDLVLMGAFATVGKEIGALYSEGSVSRGWSMQTEG